ncbi:Asp23/Gls24 family envelope stress response protein [Terrabacter terrigena]|uniref:Asp23/Gls24 family envelope stress response protein n=1 Tax=Terrabacter terrigena TaxID=574718 RepID=A0ABW3N351_9MICO
MTDPATTTPPLADERGQAVHGLVGAGARALAEPGERGRLEIAEKVVERVASFAAGEVRGVRRVGTGLEGVVGRQYPRAKAEVAGGRARIRMDIAVAWPSQLGQTARAVRDRVREQVEALVGVAVDAVDVTVASVVATAAGERRRVR